MSPRGLSRVCVNLTFAVPVEPERAPGPSNGSSRHSRALGPTNKAVARRKLKRLVEADMTKGVLASGAEGRRFESSTARRTRGI